MNRRQLFASLVGGAVFATSGLSAVVGGLQLRPVPRIRKRFFEARLNEPFMLRRASSGAKLKARLEAVDSAGEGEQFFVRFRAGTETELAEDIYMLTARDGQELVLRMEPSHSGESSLMAVINQQIG